ncbi:MAG: ABC transporter permease [Candidatus Dormibacteraeota bacterium]|nr:ABC transporter permease [Candidatus Dormibacteraeota bacterium]
MLPLPVGRRADRVLERHITRYRRLWLFFTTGVVEPVFYLLAIGFGVGGLVGTVSLGGHAFSYPVFVAPALMASAAMNGAIMDSTFGLFYKLKYAKTYDAMLATPIAVDDIALGEVAWSVMRGLIYSSAFIVLMAALRLVVSPWALLAVPAAALVGFTFAAVGCAGATFLRSWNDFDILMLILLPLFLFSATFYPVTVYPPPVRVLVELTPLYRSVDLLRALTTGSLGWSMVADVVYLLALGGLGLAVTGRRLGRLLLR